MDKIDKEKERKRAWYEANKKRLKEQRAAKESNPTANESRKPEKLDINSDSQINLSKVLLVFYASVCMSSSILLINFTAQILGKSLIGWACSILLEIGIVTLSVLKPYKQLEYWSVKFLFVVFTTISLVILHAGSLGSANKLISLKMDLATELVNTSKKMPKDHTTKKLDALKTAKNALDPINTKENHDPGFNVKLSKLLIRLALMIENLLFAHLFFRLVSKK